MSGQGPDIFDIYTHFAIINNGMRGPFAAAGDAAAAAQHWAAPFIGMLGREVTTLIFVWQQVKLV